MVVFIIHGARGLLSVHLVQSVILAVTACVWGIANGRTSLVGIISSLALWTAVVLGGAIIIHQLLVSSRQRARELDSLSEQLLESEHRLRESERSAQRILEAGVAELDELAAEAQQRASSETSRADIKFM
jgi:hypothetical protein